MNAKTRATAHLRTNVEGKPGESVVLRLKRGQLPVLEVTNDKGVTEVRAVGLPDLLGLLDRSTVLENVREEARRHVGFPDLPRNTILADYYQFGELDVYCLSGWIEAFEQPFVLGDSVYMIPLKPIVWRATWIENTKTLRSLSLAFSRHPTVTPDSGLYRWPFSNIQGAYGDFEVCWGAKSDSVSEMGRIPEEGVIGFLSSRNNDHLFGQSATHRSTATSYEAFLAEIQREGVIADEWLIPHEYESVREFHEAGKRRLLAHDR